MLIDLGRAVHRNCMTPEEWEAGVVHERCAMMNIVGIIDFITSLLCPCFLLPLAKSLSCLAN